MGNADSSGTEGADARRGRMGSGRSAPVPKTSATSTRAMERTPTIIIGVTWLGLARGGLADTEGGWAAVEVAGSAEAVDSEVDAPSEGASVDPSSTESVEGRSSAASVFWTSRAWATGVGSRVSSDWQPSKSNSD